jgi:hypothetical protein
MGEHVRARGRRRCRGEWLATRHRVRYKSKQLMVSSSQPLMLPSMLDVVSKLTTTNVAPLYLLAMAFVRQFPVDVSPLAFRPATIDELLSPWFRRRRLRHSRLSLLTCPS